MFLNYVLATVSVFSGVTEGLICNFDEYGFLVASDVGVMAYDQDLTGSGTWEDIYVNKVIMDPSTREEFGIGSESSAMWDPVNESILYVPADGDLNSGLMYNGYFSIARLDSDAKKLIIYRADGGGDQTFLSDYHYGSQDLLSLTTNPLDGSLVAAYGVGANVTLDLYTVKLDSTNNVFFMVPLSEVYIDFDTSATITGVDMLKDTATNVNLAVTWTAGSDSAFGYVRLNEDFEVESGLVTLDRSQTVQYKSVTPCRAEYDVAVHEQTAYPDFGSTDRLCQEGYIRTSGDVVRVLYDSSDVSYGIPDVGPYTAVDVVTKEVFTTDASGIIHNYSTQVSTNVELPTDWMMTGVQVYGTFYIAAVNLNTYQYYILNPATDSEWTELTATYPDSFSEIQTNSMPVALFTEPTEGTLLIAGTTPSLEYVGCHHLMIDVTNAEFKYGNEFTNVYMGLALGQTALTGAAVYRRELPAEEGHAYVWQISASGTYGEVSMNVPLTYEYINTVYASDFDNAELDERYTIANVQHCAQDSIYESMNAYGQRPTTTTSTTTTPVSQELLDRCNCECTTCVRCKFPQCECGAMTPP